MRRRQLDRAHLLAPVTGVNREDLQPSTRARMVYSERLLLAAIEAKGWHLPLGPDAATLLLYEQAERGCKPSYMDHLTWVLGRLHLEAGYDDPTISPVVARFFARLSQVVPTRTEGARALLCRDVWCLVDAIRDKIGAVLQAQDRDSAALLVGHSLGARAGELLSMRVEHLRRIGYEGYSVLIPRSKGDSRGKGIVKGLPRNLRDPQHCPVEALERWLGSSGLRVGVSVGPLWRPVRKGGRVVPRALSYSALYVNLKRYARLAGVDAKKLSPHSMRAGIVTEGVRAGLPSAAIMRISGHRTEHMIARYYREEHVLDEHPLHRIWARQSKRRG